MRGIGARRCETQASVIRCAHGYCRVDSLFLPLLELVWPKDTNTVLNLGLGETTIATLKKLQDLLHDNVLNVYLVLVVQVGRSELDL